MSPDPFAPNLFSNIWRWLTWPLHALFCPSRSWLCHEPGSLMRGSQTLVLGGSLRLFPPFRCRFKDKAGFLDLIRLSKNTSNRHLLELMGPQRLSSRTPLLTEQGTQSQGGASPFPESHSKLAGRPATGTFIFCLPRNSQHALIPH